MKYLIPICLLFSLNTLKSQSFWVKGYLGIANEPQLSLVTNLDPRFISVRNVNQSRLFAMPAIAYAPNKKTFWELGATWGSRNEKGNFAILFIPPNDSVGGVNLGNSQFKHLGVQLDYNYRFSKNEGNRWQTFIGAALNFHRSSFDFNSEQPFVSSRKADYLGAKIGIVPRALCQLSKNLKLDLNIALFLIDAERQKTASTGATGSFNSDLIAVKNLNGYYLRAGLAWRIGEKKADDSDTH